MQSSWSGDGEKLGRSVPYISEAMKVPPRDKDEVSGTGLNSLVVVQELKLSLQNVERLCLSVMDVRWRSGSRWHGLLVERVFASGVLP